MRISSVFAVKFFLLIILFAFASVNAENGENIYIKVNLWTNELYVMKSNKVIRQYPISPGTEESPTPIGVFKIVSKSKEWGGGFGTRWLGLNVPWGEYGIHGTNKPGLIGKNVSSGCVRMRNEDVEALFDIIPEGTTVKIDGPVTGTGKGEFKSLSLGSKGNLVQLVQERLKGNGFYTGKVNGIYDLETEKAVEQFQTINHLPITGGITVREYMLLGMLE